MVICFISALQEQVKIQVKIQFRTFFLNRILEFHAIVLVKTVLLIHQLLM